jgi:hypothetical protein
MKGMTKSTNRKGDPMAWMFNWHNVWMDVRCWPRWKRHCQIMIYHICIMFKTLSLTMFDNVLTMKWSWYIMIGIYLNYGTIVRSLSIIIKTSLKC